MNHFEEHWQAYDGLQLFAQGWEPDSRPVGVVCLIHGLGEHSGRYAHMGRFLSSSGFALLALDLRGNGRSGGKKGHSPSLEAFMRDIDLLVQQARNRYPGLALFVYGHSLGGTMTLNWVIRRQPQLAGVIVSGAGLRTELHKQKIKYAFAMLAGNFLPGLTISTGLDANQLSRDPEVVQAYLRDPLVHNVATLGMARANLSSIPWAFQHAADFPPLPLLMMHGTLDRLCYPAGSQEFTRLLSNPCITLKLWDGLSHELHNEPEQEQVFAFLVAWLRQNL